MGKKRGNYFWYGYGAVYVFENPRTGMRYVNIFKVFDRYRTKAGLKDVRFHDLRHTLGTRLAEAGTSPWLIQMILGHADVKTTQRYVHPDKKSALESVENLCGNDESCHATVTSLFTAQ